MNNQNAYLKKLTLTAIFIALGVLLAPLVSFPFGGARVFPLQHLINVLLAVLLGWRYSVAGAFCISSIRIALGVGTILAYPGSMIGACLSGILYKKTGSIWGAVVGEIFGTGILGGLDCLSAGCIYSRFQSRGPGSLSSRSCLIHLLVPSVGRYSSKSFR